MDAQSTDPDFLLERARALYPALRERAAGVEAARKISPDSFNEMKQAGLFQMTQPKAYGGWALPYHVFCQAVMEVAQGCPSTGWILAVIGEHNLTLGAYYPKEAQDDVWAENPETYIGSGNSPNLVYEEREDGWLVNGQLRYSSGCEFVTWHMTGGRVGGQPVRILFPQSGCEIVDTWNAMGLAGTGSHDLKLTGVLLPAHRIRFGTNADLGSTRHRYTASRNGLPAPLAWPQPWWVPGRARCGCSSTWYLGGRRSSEPR